MSKRNFDLPKRIDVFLATLSKLYAQDSKRLLQEIIVNARIRIHEEWETDDYQGTSYGHALYLIVPESLYLSLAKRRSHLQDEIRKDLNNIKNVLSEYIAVVFIEMELAEDSEWRQASGVLVAGQKTVTPNAIKRIWGDGFRVFFSHKVSVKKETVKLKEQLSSFGITCFVAHKDINPTTTWQNEIENALSSMDGFVALMTPDFHDSIWTDQEVGYAFARGVPMIAVKLGLDPYGFIGKFQALTCSWETAANEIVNLFIKNDRMYSAYVKQLRSCPTWEKGNVLGKVLGDIDSLTELQVQELVGAYEDTKKLHGSFAFNGAKPRFYGPGLAAHLKRITGLDYEFTADHAAVVPF